MASARVGGDFPFEVSLSGYSGHLQIQPLPPVYRDTALNTLPGLILPPPVAPETPETLLKSIEDRYLLPALDDTDFNVEEDGRYWDFDWYTESSHQLQPCLPRFGLVPLWEPPWRRKKIDREDESNGHPKLGPSKGDEEEVDWIPRFEQIEITNAGAKPHNSSSILRTPGPPSEFVKGRTSNHPFRPGGIEVSSAPQQEAVEGAWNGEWLREVLEGGTCQTVPPGFKQGMDFGAAKPLSRRRHMYTTPADQQQVDTSDAKEDKLPIMDVAFDETIEDTNKVENVEGGAKEQGLDDLDAGTHEYLDTVEVDLLHDMVAATKSVLETLNKVKTSKQQSKSEVWAVMDRVEGIDERFSDLVPDMAMRFPFKLDVFQKEAIYHLERNESVFVAAHTSAGKTVVAEYAFALAAKHCTRAVYTSPIKTISNQKYRDFSEKFDVGLLTGDVSIRPDASCLIMTTEILRSMLYKGADIVRDIEWVIFDEVHYVNDIERGVVWEEVIIMLPEHVNMVLLSATVPNTQDFAGWIGRTKRKKIYVTGTTRRPVPLEHCLYYSGELYRICEQERFLEEGIKQVKEAHHAKTAPKPAAGGSRGVPVPGRGGAMAGRGVSRGAQGNQGRGRGGPPKTGAGGQAQKIVQAAIGSTNSGWRSETSQWYSLVNKLSKMNLLPIVVFCFSKARCDQSADSLTASDLTTGSEKSVIRVFCDKAFSRLKGTDRKLPQVVRVEELLRRGIGVHHAGLLPIVKEVVEMLFCRGVIKVLFSTETFAMGVNAPARTVAFHSLSKHDGRSFRQLLPGEYTQMAGRAGRRGLDKVGTVLIMCWEEIPEEGVLKRLLTGKPTKLESQFRLTYSMILNLLRVEDLKVEDMLKRSFAEFHAQRALPEQESLLREKEGSLSKLNETIECILGDASIEDYYDVFFEVGKLGAQIQDTITQSRAFQQCITPGRIVLIQGPPVLVPRLAVVIKQPSPSNKFPIVLAVHDGPIPVTSSSIAAGQAANLSKSLAEEGFVISRKGNLDDDEYAVKGRNSKKASGAKQVALPYYETSNAISYVVMEVDNKNFVSICVNKIRVDGARLLEEGSTAAREAVVQELAQLGLDYSAGNLPALDPLKDLKLNDLDVVEKYRKRQLLLDNMARNKCHGCPKFRDHFLLVKDQHTLKERVKELKYNLSDAALQQMPDFQQRIEVLQEVGCIDADLIVQLKGRVACEINSGDELIATECLFDNQLDDLSPAETVALLSALVFQQKDASEPVLTERLEYAKERLYDTALRLGAIQARHGLPINAEDYARDALKFGLMEVVYEWAKGTPFSDICELTNVPEGSVVRSIVRLDEVCREFKDAARLIGDSALYEKMDAASTAIKRDIVFAPSLYVTAC